MSRLIYSVEDDQNISFVINKTLTNSGFKVKSFSDGESFFKGLEDEIPDLALVDIMLPNGMSGLDIIKKMKANSKYDDVVIIILSAKGDEMDKVTGLDLGADDYISKPFSVLELVSRIKA
ncbi:MAG TPA: response regulator, partial [Bacilli bacterium]|nr:response regulator [Bacilli bacterium]